MQPAYLACGGWIASAVAAAAELGIADLLAERPRSIAELATATRVDEAILLRVLRTLALFDVFAEGADGTFTNTDDSAALRSGAPGSVRHFCLLAAGMYQQMFGALMHSLRTGEPASRAVFGGTIYDHMDATPAAAEIYERAMEELARPLGAALAAIESFHGVRSLVDVGGGRGTVALGLLALHPHLTAICVDRPPVCARGAAALRAADPALAARIELRPGDFFVAVPAGADLYLLKNVLHNWNDDNALSILQRIDEAMAAAAGARLWVVESLVGGAMPRKYQILDDLAQVVICEEGTTARDEAQLRGLLDRAELEVRRVLPLATGHTLFEAVRR